jgi:hypothetical protein
MAGFWTGLRVSLIRDVPFSGIFYPIYNFCKKELLFLYELKYGLSKDMNPTERVKMLALISGLASFNANVISCTLTHPLDLIRTRIFFMRYNTDST